MVALRNSISGVNVISRKEPTRLGTKFTLYCPIRRQIKKTIIKIKYQAIVILDLPKLNHMLRISNPVSLRISLYRLIIRQRLLDENCSS